MQDNEKLSQLAKGDILLPATHNDLSFFIHSLSLVRLIYMAFLFFITNQQNANQYDGEMFYAQ